MGRNQLPEGGGYARNRGDKTYAGGGGRGGGNKKTVDAATALGLGVPQQNTMLWGLAGLGMVQQKIIWTHFSDLWGTTLWQDWVA